MTGYLRNNDLYKVDVFKRALTLYFPVDDDQIVGVNKGESTDLTIYLKNKAIKRLVYRSQPHSDIFPIENVAESDMRLGGFVWLDDIRPKSPTDIFIWHTTEAVAASRRITAPAPSPDNTKKERKPLPPTRRSGKPASK